MLFTTALRRKTRYKQALNSNIDMKWTNKQKTKPHYKKWIIICEFVVSVYSSLPKHHFAHSIKPVRKCVARVYL